MFSRTEIIRPLLFYERELSLRKFLLTVETLTLRYDRAYHSKHVAQCYPRSEKRHTRIVEIDLRYNASYCYRILVSIDWKKSITGYTLLVVVKNVHN